MEKCQSGFRARHSTESAPLKVSTDLLSVDSGKCAILILPDFSAAFDSVDHCVLLNCFQELVGIQGTALKWFASYLSGQVGGLSSCSSSHITCGVPPGSVLGPILYALYMFLEAPPSASTMSLFIVVRTTHKEVLFWYFS